MNCKDCSFYYLIDEIVCIDEHCKLYGEIVSECVNDGNKCQHYKRKWWKFWVK